MDKIALRNETPSDHRIVENLTREAFWNHYAPACSEHYLLHVMRDCDAFIPELDIVAEVDGKIVGNIVYTKAKIVGDNGESYAVISFGPIAVLPEFQGKGIGGRLIAHTKQLAQAMGYRAILIYGDPDLYSKFGFVQAEEYGIGTPDNIYAAALQAFELYPGALTGCAGRFYEDSLFEVDPQAAEEFDRGFPDKERKSGLPSQARFQQVVGMRKPREVQAQPAIKE
jgi:predicted N-acetyltransferase YhbS